MKAKREWLVFLAFAGPNFLLFGLFTYWPIIYSAGLSLRSRGLPARAGEFAGLANYRSLLKDETFWTVVSNTAVYAVAVVFGAQFLAFGLALLLNQRVPGRTVFRTIAFMPHVTAMAAAALVWVLFLDPDLGPLSRLYHWMGLEGVRWLESSALALWAIVLVGTWKEIGFASLFFLSGLQDLPKDCYEAANLDGASRAGRLRYLTIPMMSPVIFFLMVSGFMAAVKMFDIVAIMTAGGPVYPASSTYVYHLYKTAFRDFDYGYASTIALVFFGLILVVTIIQFRLARRWVHYG